MRWVLIGTFEARSQERVLTPLHNTRSHDRQALRISGHVAYSALTYKVELNRGDVVLVTAGAGATGSFAVQVAKRRGCHVLATCRNAAKAEVLRGLGADRVIDYSVESVREVFEREYKGRVDVCYEGVGGAMLEDVWQVALKDDGKVLSVGYISQYPHNEVPVSAAAGRSNEALDLPPSQDVFWKAMTLERGGKTLIGNVWPDDAGDRQRALEEVVALVAAGELTCVVDSRRFVGVESAADAVSYMLSGSAIGKVVVEM
jgi:NADPH-dependent curcumin reductase CurA